MVREVLQNGGVQVLKACPRGPAFAGALFGGLALICWAAAPSLYDENLLLHGLAWLGMIFAVFAATRFYEAYRRMPILRIGEDGLELETLTERRRWRWTQTGPFVASPPVGGENSNVCMVALFPGNAAPYERATGRTAPDFVDADISIGVGPFVTGWNTESIDAAVQALLDQVNDRRDAALRAHPLDDAYTGPASEGRAGQMKWALRSRRLRFYIPICFTLLLVLYKCGAIFVQ